VLGALSEANPAAAQALMAQATPPDYRKALVRAVKAASGGGTGTTPPAPVERKILPKKTEQSEAEEGGSDYSGDEKGFAL